jgi:hypothetical protein
MSNSINLIKQAEKARRDKPVEPKRPRLVDGFKFPTQPPSALDKFSPHEAIGNSDKSSSGLKIDDESNNSDRDTRIKLRNQHLDNLKRRGTVTLNRKSMHNVVEQSSPLVDETQ